MEIEEKLAIARSVAQAVLVDGQIKDEEVQLLRRLMTRYGLTREQRLEVTTRDLGEPASQLVEGIGGPASRVALLEAVAEAMLVDGHLAESEKLLLEELAVAMGGAKEAADAILHRVSLRGQR